MPYFPTTEAHYLTSAGDMVDKICWDYYGITTKTAELTYKRNPFLAQFKAILPAGLLIVLPIVVGDEVLPKANLWNYTQPTLPELFVPTQRAQIAIDEAAKSAAELSALDAYLAQRNYVAAVGAVNGVGTGVVDTGSGVDTGGSGAGIASADAASQFPISDVTTWEKDLEPLTVSDYDYVAVWYRTASGKWGLGKILKSVFNAASGLGSGGGSGGGTPTGFPTGWNPISTEMIVQQPSGDPFPSQVTVLAYTG